jgi:4-amino-4-deoxy-L-arabinose transferase-like glycosyltransferase
MRVRLVRSEDPRLWVAVGAAAGLGMMAKYAMAFFAAAIFAGFLLTDAHRNLASRWLLAGCAVALVIWASNLAWEAEHQFVSFDSCARREYGTREQLSSRPVDTHNRSALDRGFDLLSAGGGREAVSRNRVDVPVSPRRFSWRHADAATI